MAEILNNQELELDNLLSFRGKVSNEQLQQVNQEMEQLIKSVEAKKNGYPITATYGVEETILDIEILIPVNKRIECNNTQFVFKDKLKIVNAVKSVHKGNPATLQDTCNELNQYMMAHQMVPITVGYNVTKKVDMLDINQSEIEVYVGISPNIL